jgi:hypothetical protein
MRRRDTIEDDKGHDPISSSVYVSLVCIRVRSAISVGVAALFLLLASLFAFLISLAFLFQFTAVFLESIPAFRHRASSSTHLLGLLNVRDIARAKFTNSGIDAWGKISRV